MTAPHAAWGGVKNPVLGLQQVTVPWLLTQKAKVIVQLGVPGTCSLGPCRGHGSADLLNLALATRSLPWVRPCVWGHGWARAPTLKWELPQTFFKRCVPLRLVHSPHANPASYPKAWLWKQNTISTSGQDYSHKKERRKTVFIRLTQLLLDP